jgi:hypothetical protein
MLPFHAIVELARGLFGVDEGASAAEVRDAVRRGLASVPTVDPIALAFWLELFGPPIPRWRRRSWSPRRAVRVCSSHSAI